MIFRGDDRRKHGDCDSFWCGSRPTCAHAGSHHVSAAFRRNDERLTANSSRCSLSSPSQDEVFREEAVLLSKESRQQDAAEPVTHQGFSPG